MSRIVELWRRMASMYGNTWASQYGSQPEGVAADTWAATLSGLNGEQIAEGLRACVAEGDEFPPGAPRFRAMCMGIPLFARVRIESTRPDAERSPFTRSVWQFVDGYAYRNASSRESVRMLREAFELAREERMRGAALPAPSEAIEGPAQPQLPTLPGDRDARAQRLQSLLGEDYNPATADPDYDPAVVHSRIASPDERRAAEAELATLHDEDELP